jgi:hypothetical protein
MLKSHVQALDLKLEKLRSLQGQYSDQCQTCDNFVSFLGCDSIQSLAELS